MVNAGALVVVLAVALLAAVAGAMVQRRAHAARIRRAAEAVSRVGEGEGEAVADLTGSPELDALGQAVDAMADRLRRQVGGSRDEQHVRDLILTTMQEGVLLVDAEDRVVFTNDAFERHLRMRPTVLGGLLPLTLRQAVERAAAAREVTSVEVETGTPSRWLRGTAVPATSGGSVLLVVRDVTEAKRIDAIRRDFVANASHELKTPAASIRATAETIRRAAGDDLEVVPRFAEQLEREAIRLSRIVSDLLDLSRLESGSDLGELVGLDSLVREEAGRFEESARTAGVMLDVDAAPVPAVRGSARDLALLVRNLLDNAIRYTRDGGRVEVALVEGEHGEVVLRVADTGVGIPSRDLPRVFERFYRVDRARSRGTGGTGLGLAIVRHVAENHGGRVDVDSQLGQGTRFEVRLPPAGAEAPRPLPGG